MALVGCVPTIAHASVTPNPFTPRHAAAAAAPTNVVVHGRYIPIVGDFDCNGRDDIFWYAPGRAQDFVWYSTPNGFVSHEYTVNGVYRTAVADLNGDGCSDIVWHAPGAAMDYIWFGSATKRFAFKAIQVWGSYTPIAMRGKLWWFNPAEQYNAVWTFSGSSVYGGALNMRALLPYVGAGPVRPVVLDVDANGLPDVVMYRPGSFRAAYLFGTRHPDVFSPHVGETPGDDLVPLAGNFDGAPTPSLGADEIFWYGPGSEPDYAWFNGAAYYHGTYPFIRLRTKINGADYDPLVGDFDGAGHDEIFWYVPGSGGRIWADVHHLPLVGQPYITDIAAGAEQSCAIVDGDVKCSGANRFGELGDGTTDPSDLPVAVRGLPPGEATSVVAGFGYTCAIDAGGVWCWGLNNYGQLGDGTTASSTTAVRVPDLDADVQSIAVSDNYTGREHTCAIAVGQAWCWGYNGDGELGDGTTTSRTQPVAVHGLTASVTSITVGDRVVVCRDQFCRAVLGANDSGQLGTGNTTSSLIPVPVSGLTHADGIGAGPAFVCAEAVNTAVRCWGDNAYGQLGTGDTAPHLAPVPALGLPSVNDGLAVGFDAACVNHDEVVYCWGRSFDSTPHHVVGLLGITTALSANVAKCAITSRNDAVCWGPNEKGEVGNGVATGGLAFPPGQPVDNAPYVVLHLTLPASASVVWVRAQPLRLLLAEIG